MATTVEKQVRTIYHQELYAREPMKIRKKDDLEHIGMDSLNCIELIVKLEDVFHIQVPDAQLSLSYVRSIQAICNLVEQCLDNKEMAI